VNHITCNYLGENFIKFDDYIIFEICDNENTYKQIPVEEFVEKLTSKKNTKPIEKIINYDSLEIKTDSSEVYRDGVQINLSTKEYKLLRIFIDNKGKILTNEQIINCVWGIAYANIGMLRVAIKRLRSKIDPNNEYLKTIRGKGYTFINL